MIFSTLGAAIIDSSGWQTCYRVWVLITLVLGVPLSLHFPTRGKTYNYFNDVTSSTISIHFPPRGKTETIPAGAAIEFISIHFPPRGKTLL